MIRSPLRFDVCYEEFYGFRFELQGIVPDMLFYLVDGSHHLHMDPETAPVFCGLLTRFLRAVEEKGVDHPELLQFVPGIVEIESRSSLTRPFSAPQSKL